MSPRPHRMTCSCGKVFIASANNTYRCPACQHAADLAKHAAPNRARYHHDKPVVKPPEPERRPQYPSQPAILRLSEYGLKSGDILEVIKDPDDSMIIGGRLDAGEVVGMIRLRYLADGAAFRDQAGRVLVVEQGELRMTP